MQLKLNPKIFKNMELKSENMQNYAAKTPKYNKYAVKKFYFIKMYDPESELK
jgi:hypothetical protein